MDGKEDERFNTTLSVKEVEGVIQTRLTYLSNGQQRSMNFLELPFTMQVSRSGGWSLGPGSITPFNWVGEMCVVRRDERRRIIVRHGASGLDQVVYVIETKGSKPPQPPRIPLQCQMERQGDWSVWRPEPDVELLLDTRQRSTGDATVCGLAGSESTGTYARSFVGTTQTACCSRSRILALNGSNRFTPSEVVLPVESQKKPPPGFENVSQGVSLFPPHEAFFPHETNMTSQLSQ